MGARTDPGSRLHPLREVTMSRRALLACVLAVIAACGGAVDATGAVVDGGHDAGGGAPPPEHGSQRTPTDGGTPDREAAAPRPDIDLTGIPELADCLPSPYELHVHTTGGSMFPAGVFGIDGTKGNWSGRVTAQVITQLDIAPGWLFTWNDLDGGLKVGTYVIGERSPRVGVAFDGKGCGGKPGDTFTVVDYASTGGDQASLTRLVAWFDLTCDSVGNVRGCVRYGQ